MLDALEDVYYSRLDPGRVTDMDALQISELGKDLSQNARMVSRRELKKSAKRHHILVARAGDRSGRIVGMGRLVLDFSPLMGKKAIMHDIVMHRDFQGLRIGKTIIEKLIQKARQFEVKSIRLSCGNKREKALKLYDSLGFKKVDTNVYELAPV